MYFFGSSIISVSSRDVCDAHCTNNKLQIEANRKREAELQKLRKLLEESQLEAEVYKIKSFV